MKTLFERLPKGFVLKETRRLVHKATGNRLPKGKLSSASECPLAKAFGFPVGHGLKGNTARRVCMMDSISDDYTVEEIICLTTAFVDYFDDYHYPKLVQ